MAEASVFPRPSRTSYQLGLLLVTLAAIAWSTAGLFTRLIPLDIASVLVWRGVFGAIGLALAILILSGRSGLAGFARLGRAGWLYAVVSAAAMLCFISALVLTTVAHVAVIYATVPFIAAALGWIGHGERPTASALAASLAALAGVAVMTGWDAQGNLLGNLLALGMTVMMAVMMIIARRSPSLPTAAAACLSALLSAAAALPFAVVAVPSPIDLGLLALFGLVNSALGLYLFTLGSRYLPPVETALITALDAPLAPLWVWLIVSETPGQATIIGGAIVLVAVTVHIIHTNREVTA